MFGQKPQARFVREGSLGALVGHRHAMCAPIDRISGTKVGKLVAIMSALSTDDGLARGKPHDEEAHRDAVIVVRADLGSAGRRPSEPFDDQAVALFARVNATGAQPRDDSGEAIALLDAQLGQAVHDRSAVRESGGNREDRIFVDHRRRAVGRHFDAGQSRTRSQSTSAIGLSALDAVDW